MSVSLVIGGAQFGTSYGIANRTGVPTPETVFSMLSQARDAGVDWIDTARAYPGSEAAIGEALEKMIAWPVCISTKLPPLGRFVGGGPDVLTAAIRHSLAESRRLLGRPVLDAVLLHRWEDYGREGSLVADIICEEQEAGRIRTFGVSVQTPSELDEALTIELVQHVQLPFNILDNRWEAWIPRIRCTRQERQMCVHARSLLLQGLFLSDRPEHWHRAHVTNPTCIRGWLSEQVRACNRRGLQDLCLAWGHSQDWIDGLVVGAETTNQMMENLRDCAAAPLQAHELERIRVTRPQLSTEALDPAQWIGA